MIAGKEVPLIAARVFRVARLLILCGCFHAACLRAEDLSFTNLMAQGNLCDQQHDTSGALGLYLKAEPLAPTNCELLCQVAKQYWDLMHSDKSVNEKKSDAAKALAYGQRAVAADTNSPKAHVCLAICYAKNFPYIDNTTKVHYSREIKAESEKSLALDPKYDLPYHMLGRWNYEVANMNILMAGLLKIAYGGLPHASNQAAIDNFKKAIELAPNRIIHHLQLAHVYHITKQERLCVVELNQCRDLKPLDLEDSDAQKIAIKILGTGKWPAIF